MKKKLLRSAIVTAFLFLLIAGRESYSQTAGTLEFSVTTTSTGGFSPDHFLAIWIENSVGTFIKTKVRYTNSGDLNHMQTWVQKSGENIVDATTGASLTSHGTVTLLWNGTNVAGTLVADGSYFVWLEMAWDQSLTTGKTVNSYPFTKGPSLFQSNPANTANFLNMSVKWTPSTTGIEGALEGKEINVYPNPNHGSLNIDFKQPQAECLLQIINEAGKVQYAKKLSNLPVGPMNFDLSALPDGAYYCTLRFPEKTVVFTLILSK
jgi:hypothetical protein